MIRGGAVISMCMLAIGSIYASGASQTEGGRWAIIVLIYVFVVGFTSTWAIVIRIITSEVQPTRTRAAVSSFGQGIAWVRRYYIRSHSLHDLNLHQVINWLVALTTPFFIAKSASGPYFLFGCCCLMTTLVCLAFQPETQESTLEDVDQAFGESPWKIAFNRSRFRDSLSGVMGMTGIPRPGVQRLFSMPRLQRRSAAVEDDDDHFEVDVIRVPELQFGGPWHYADRAAYLLSQRNQEQEVQ